MIIPTLIVSYCSIILALNLFSPVKVGFISWFQLLFVKTKLPVFSLAIKSVALQIRPMYLFHWRKLQATHHEGLFVLHISKLNIDMGAGSGSTGVKPTKKSSSGLSPSSIVNIVKWIRWLFPISIVIHSLEICNSQIDDYKNKVISLDSLTLSMSTLLDADLLNSKFHLDVTRALVGQTEVLKTAKWTCSFTTVLSNLEDIFFQDIRNLFVTQGVTLDVQSIQDVVQSVFPKTTKIIEPIAEESTPLNPPSSNIDIDMLMHKFRIESIYFGFDDTSVLLDDVKINIKDIACGLHLMDRDHAICKRYSNLKLHKLTAQLTGLLIKPTHLSNTSQFIEFTNISSIWDLKCVVNILKNIDDTEHVKRLCSDDSFIARSFMTLANISFMTTLEDILQQQFLTKKKAMHKPPRVPLSELEIILDNDTKSQRMRNILMITHNIRTRVQLLTSCVSIRSPEGVTFQCILDDMLFDSSYTDNISSLFNSAEDAYTPTKAVVLNLRNFRFDILNEKLVDRCFTINEVKLSASLGINVDDDQIFVHDIGLEIDHVEMCIDNITLVKKMNVIATTMIEIKKDYKSQLDVISHALGLDNIVPEIDTEVEKKTAPSETPVKAILPKYIQTLNACVKSVTFVSCFTNPVKYFNGVDFTEMNSYKRGIGLKLTNLTLTHDNTVDIPVFDVHLNHLIVNIIKNFDSTLGSTTHSKMCDLKHFKLCYTRLNDKLSMVFPVLDITYSVEALWSILFVKTVLMSLKGKPTHNSQQQLVNHTTPPEKQKKNSTLNVVVTLHLLKLHVILPSNVELAVELDTLVYAKLPTTHDHAMVSFRAFRIYGQNPHTEGMWTLIMIWDNIKMKINDNVKPGGSKIDMKCNAVRIEIPYEYLFYMAFDNLKALTKSSKIIEHNFKDLMYIEDYQTDFNTSKLMPSLVDNISALPKIRIRSNHFIYCNHDDPFEEELTSFFMLGRIEQRVRIEKFRDFEKYETKMSKMLEDKYSHILTFKDGKALMPLGYSEHLQKNKISTTEMKRASTFSTLQQSPLSSVSRDATLSISPPTARPAEELISGSFQAWIQYKLDYHQAIEIPRSRLFSNLSKSWITKVKAVKKSNDAEIENEYFKNRGKKDPGVRDTFFKKFPIVSEGNSHPLFGFIVTNLDWTIDEPDFGIDNYQNFMHKKVGGMPMDMKYGIFVPMNWKLGCSQMKFQIKDYPLPMVGFGSLNDPPNSVVFSGDFVVFEQEFTLDEIRYNYVPLVSQYDQHSMDENLYSIHVPRTMTNVKFVTDWDIHVTSTKNSIISWAPSFQPGIKYAMDSFDLLSKPPLDTSPKIGFWDKFPLLLHGRATFHFKSGLDLFIKSSQSPYDMTGRSIGFVFRWSDETKLKINSSGKSEDLLIVESNAFEIAIPSFDAKYFTELMTRGSGRTSDYTITKSVLKLTSKPIIWKLGFKFERNLFQQESFDPGHIERTDKFRPHYDVRLKNPITFNNEEEEETWDSYEGWRSHYIYMALSIYSKDETGHKGFPCYGGIAYNTLSLTPLTVLHFFFWWNAFQSSLGLPIKEGPLFKNKFLDDIQSPKFGEHLSGISYSVILSPLYLAHVYRHVSNSIEKKVAFTGLKCFVKSFAMDMHQSKQAITIYDETTKEARKEYHLKMNKGVVDFVDADLRILSAVFDQKHDLASLANAMDLSPSTTGGFQDNSSSNNSEFLTDKNWYDKNDYVELEASKLPDEEPKWKLLLLASSPRFYYIRDEKVADVPYPFDDIEKSTHTCQIGRMNVSEAACEIVDSRVEMLEEIIEVHKSQLLDLDTKPISDIAKKMKDNLQSEMHELHHRLHILHSLRDKFINGVFPQYDEFVNDYDVSDSEDDIDRTQSNALSRISSFSSQSNISRMRSKISTAPLKSSNYRNRFIVYGVNIKWTSHTRNGFLGYLDKVNDRRFAVFSTSQKAVNLAEDLCKAQNSFDKNTSDSNKTNGEFYDSKFDAEHEFTTSEEILDDLNNLLHSTIDNASADDSYLMKLVLPQISSSTNSKDCVLIASNRIVVRNVTIEEFQGNDVISGSNISVPIEQRTAVTIDDAFVYVLDRNDLINGVYNLFNAKDLAWPPQLPLEMYYSPTTLDKTIVLQNLSCAMFIVQPNSLHYSKDENLKSKNMKTTTKLIIPDVQIVCDSKQFAVMYEIFKSMTVSEKSEIQKMKESVKNFIQFSDFTNYEQVLESLVDMQAKCRNLIFCKRMISTMNLAVGFSPEEINNVSVELERLYLNLNGISDFLRTLKSKKYNDSFEISDWSIIAPSIQIKLISSEDLPFIEINATDTIYKFVNSASGSSLNTVFVLDFVINDRHPKAIYDTVLARLDNSKTPMFLMDWHMTAAVGGIPFLQRQHMSFSPLKIAVDTRMTSELQKFLFPESEIVNSTPFDDLDDLLDGDDDESFDLNTTLSRNSSSTLNSTSSQKHSGILKKSLSKLIPNKLLKPSKDSQQLSPSPTVSAHDSESTLFNSVVNKSVYSSKDAEKHVNQMKTRAKKYFSAHEIVINPAKLCVTFKGQGKLSLINLSGFVVSTPKIEIRNKVISNEEVFAIVRNKMIQAVLSNSGSLIKSKLKINRNSKKPKNVSQKSGPRMALKTGDASKHQQTSHHHHHHQTVSNGHFKDVDLLGPDSIPTHLTRQNSAKRLTLSELVAKHGNEIQEEMVFHTVEEEEEEEEDAEEDAK